MAEVQIVLPKMGESVMEATVLRWLKQEGDEVAAEEVILEVATDKVNAEVPSPYAGKLQQRLVSKGTVVKVEAPVAIIMTAGEEGKLPLPTAVPPFVPSASTVPPAPPTLPVPMHQPKDGRHYSPLVRHIAQQENIASEELEQIPGTGQDNRVTKRDLLAYLHHRPAASEPQNPLAAAGAVSITPEDEVIPLDRVRQVTAKRMVAAKRSVPHVTSFVEADVTELVQWKEQHQAAFAQQAGVKLTYTPLLLQAVVRALQDFPKINAWLLAEQQQLVQKKNIHLGLAVALPDGNLVVPVLQQAGQLSLVELAQQVHTLSHGARQGKLGADELAGPTYTVSNLGTFQNLMGTPIIMPPQVATLALGAIVKKPGVVPGEQGDAVALRHKMYLSHAYDHRVVDGALGGGFVQRVADYLQRFVHWVCW